MAAVALAITAVAFLAIRTDLQNQVRQEVAARADSVEHEAHNLRAHPDGWVPPHSSRFGVSRLHPGDHGDGRRLGGGRPCRAARADAADIDVAGGDSAAFFAIRKVSGTRWCSPRRSPPASPSRWPSR